MRRLFLDACVLFPRLSRRLLLGAAEAGFFSPLVSHRVLDEWVLAAGRRGGMSGETEAAEERAALMTRFPEAPVRDWAETDLRLPDPADGHVLAAAIAGGAEEIVTFNLRDFPNRLLRPHGIAARHPDGLLWEFLSGDRGRMGAVIGAAVGEEEPRKLLKRGQFPRLGKAWAG